MYNIAVIGDYDSIYGFAALGLKICPVTDPLQGEKLIKQLTEEGCAVIYITESLASQMKETLARYEESLLPALIPIPGAGGNTGIGMEQVRRSVERAVGSDIIFKEEK